MALSPNYSWSEPDNSSLVKNGAADIRTLGDAIDTSVWNVGYGQAAKNKIINGNMYIDQRNAGAAVTINTQAGSYTVDRFIGAGQTADGVFTVQQDSSAPSEFTKSAKITVTTADASIGASQFYHFGQNIEGGQIAQFAFGTSDAKTITLSFWVRSSVTGTFGGSLRNASSNRSYPFSYSIALANTWEKKSITIVGDTTGTWLTDTGIGINLRFSLGSGSSRLGTAGAWAAANYDGATGQTNLIGTLNATWYVTGVQLEYGSIATPFQTATGTIQGELAACQRYYYRTNTNNGGSFSLGQAYSTTNALGFIQFPVTMRISPTALEQTGTAANYGLSTSNLTFNDCTAVPVFNFANPNVSSIVFISTGLVAGNATHLVSKSNSPAFLGWSAEL